MVNFINKNSLLNCFQSGFRSNHSCTTALLKVSEDLRADLDNNEIAFLVLLDHSRAFDTIDHNILYLKLQKFFNFSEKAVMLIRSYLSMRSQSVSVGNRLSAALYNLRGVPQGSILGPLLYSIYCNDIPDNIKFCRIHMYADDVQLYISSTVSNLSESVCHLNNDLETVSNWAKDNGLTLNPQKSKCIIISNNVSNVAINFNVNIILSDSSIEIVNSAKNLGVIFNNRLVWNSQISTAVGKTYGVLRNVYFCQKFTPLNIRMLLAKTYLIPKLLYSCELFCNCDVKNKSRLRIAFNSIVRYVFGLSRRDHVSNYAKQIFGISFENYLNLRTLVCLHKIIYSREPQYLFDILRFSRSNRGKQLIQIRHKRRISDQHFFVNAIRLWNNLPYNIQIISNDRQFKTNLYKHFGQS